MSFYDTANLPNAESHVDLADYHSTLFYGNTSIECPKIPVSYTGTSITYTAEDLLNGYINRSTEGSISTDSFDSASNIIAALQRRITTLSGIHQPLENGTSFTCLVTSHVPSDNLYNNNAWSIRYYSTVDGSIRIGGQTNQIRGGATAELTFVVQDQARFGAGHQDQLFVCISRCAAAIAID